MRVDIPSYIVSLKFALLLKNIYSLHYNDSALVGICKINYPFDFMGAEELGANIFRVTQTDAKIKREKITGQKDLEEVAYGVGKMVRNALIENGSTLPEDLPLSEDIKQIKSGLKKTHKAFNKNDNVKKLPSKKEE